MKGLKRVPESKPQLLTTDFPNRVLIIESDYVLNRTTHPYILLIDLRKTNIKLKMDQFVDKDKDNDEPAESCHFLKEQLMYCVKRSECFQQGNSIRTCLKTGEGVDNACRVMQNSYFECRRSLLDMRQRFRGRKHSEAD